jgi:hypothetical protein
VRHTDWDELEAPVRLAIEARAGQVHSARTVSAGLNSQLAVVLDTSTGRVFVKGLRADHRRGVLPDPGDGGRSQRQPGRGAGRPVPGLAASPVRRH